MVINSKLLLVSSLLLLSSCGNDKGFGLVTSSSSTKKIFVSAVTYSGGLGGVGGADATCESDTNRPSGGGYYKALLADGSSRIACTTAFCSGGESEHSDWPLQPDTTYVRASDGVEIGKTGPSAGIFSFPLSAGFSATFGTYWSGLENNWISDADDNCTQWSSTLVTGASGGTAETDEYSIRYATNACSGTRRLVCVEQ